MQQHDTAAAENKPIKIQLAKNGETWAELQQVLESHVSEICATGDKAARSLLFLVDVLTNENFDSDQQAVAAEYVQHSAFRFSRRSVSALESLLNELNPGRVIKRRKVAINA